MLETIAETPAMTSCGEEMKLSGDIQSLELSMKIATILRIHARIVG
jgi:hypothetical protein